MFGQIVDGCVLTPAQIATLKIEDDRWPKARSSDGLMSSRGGLTFQRTFMEDFIRPPIGPENWVSRHDGPAPGVVQTGPAEMSFYLDTHWGQPTRSFRRYSLRLDGFASMGSGADSGQLTTKPLRFTGNQLRINGSCQKGGSIKVELLDAAGNPLPGFTLEECDSFDGDSIGHTMTWNTKAEIPNKPSRPIRLRMVLSSADLFAFQFFSASGDAQK